MIIDNEFDEKADELRQQLILEQIKTQRKCSECDSQTTQIRKRVRKTDGVETINEIWHDDGNGSALCHNCYSRKIRKGKKYGSGPVGRPRKVLSATAVQQPQTQTEEGLAPMVELLTLRQLRNKFPPAWRATRDTVDIIAHILEVLSAQVKQVHSLSIHTLRTIMGQSYEDLSNKLADMAEYELITAETDGKSGRSMLRVAPRGYEFLKVYRKIAELIAWIQ